MKDTSILDELNAHNKQRRGRRKYYVITLLILLAVTSTGVAAINDNKKVSTPKITASSRKIQDIQETSTPSHTSVQAPQLETASTPAPTSTQPPSNDVSMDVINAKLCRDTLNTAIEINNQNVGMYMKSWTHWRSTYEGRYDSPEALESKAWYKANYQKQYSELISRTTPDLQRLCKSATTLELTQPQYDQW